MRNNHDAENRPPEFVRRVGESSVSAQESASSSSPTQQSMGSADPRYGHPQHRDPHYRGPHQEAHAFAPRAQAPMNAPRQAQAPSGGPKQKSKKVKKKKTPAMIALDLLIIALIVAGLYFLIKPRYDHYMQDKRTAELDRLMAENQADEETGEIGLWIDPFAHPVNSGGLDLPPGMTEEELEGALPKPGERVFVQSLARMVIRDIDLNMPIVYGASDAPLQVGLGWYPNSVPLEDDGNSVVLGHRMWDYGRHFNRLDEVDVGDAIEVFKDGKRYIYRMTDSIVLEPDAMFQYFDPGDENVLTLVTCTPKRSFEDRLLVFAELESVQDDTSQGLPEEAEES